MIERIVKAAKKNWIVTKIRTKFPRFFLYTVVKPLSWIRYQDAKKVLKGKVQNLPDRPSILLFTTEKCASTYTKTIISKLAKDVGMFSADIEAYFSVTDVNPITYFSNPIHRKQVFKPTGRYLGPLRNPYPIEEIEEYCKILVLRDPRDVLTSYYYSILHSHIVISEDFYAKRKHFENHDIDTFVREYYPIVKAKYEAYIGRLISLDNLTILPYELLVTNFEGWLSRLLKATHLNDVSPEVIQDIIDTEQSVTPDKSKTSHIRNKLPGDFKRKLKPETQQFLTEELKEILEVLGYETT